MAVPVTLAPTPGQDEKDASGRMDFWVIFVTNNCVKAFDHMLQYCCKLIIFSARIILVHPFGNHYLRVH